MHTYSRLMQTVATCLGYDSDLSNLTASEVAHLQTVTDACETAIGLRKHARMHDKQLARRVCAFVSNLDKTDNQILLLVSDQLGKCGLDDHHIHRFLRKFSPDLLRTLDSNDLQRHADHYKTWDPLIQYLTGEVDTWPIE